MSMQRKLDAISSIATRDGKAKIHNLIHLLGAENLVECFGWLKRGKAVGIDGVDVPEYEKNLVSNLQDLVGRMKTWSYRPQPVRRVNIPKANGKTRPLGIPSVEDKVVQVGIARILESIYEVDFQDCSYGFRPKRGCHQALNRLDKIIMSQPINYIIDADIKGFFDNVNHQWMQKFLEHRIADHDFIRLINRFLRNGYMEGGEKHETEQGTPQGGIISPILANIYLHYVLDLWLERIVKSESAGMVEMVRYADDFVICVQFKEDAERILAELTDRLKKFNLELAPEKTRLIEFGRYAKANAKKRKVRLKTVKTFNFLGFTHFIDKTLKGGFKLGRKTDSKKMRNSLKELNLWLKQSRNLVKINVLWKKLQAKLRGHFQYYGVSGNYKSIDIYRSRAIRLTFKWLNRRSQKKSFSWESFRVYLKQYPLPKTQLHHNFYTLGVLT